MRPDAHDAALMWDMMRFARDVQEFVAGKSWPDYQREKLLRAGVERCVLLIGEAASKISPEFRDAHPEIPWKPIVTQRHRLVHDYGRIDDEKIWRVATVHVPDLIRQLVLLIPPPPPDPFPEPPDS